MPWGVLSTSANAVSGPSPRMACIMIHEFCHTCHHPLEGTPDKA